MPNLDQSRSMIYEIRNLETDKRERRFAPDVIELLTRRFYYSNYCFSIRDSDIYLTEMGYIQVRPVFPGGTILS